MAADVGRESPTREVLRRGGETKKARRPPCPFCRSFRVIPRCPRAG